MLSAGFRFVKEAGVPFRKVHPFRERTGSPTISKEAVMSEEKSRNGPARLKLVLGGATLGVVALATLAFGMKYTDQRPFCTSCHIMDPVGVTHKLSGHANISCNDCHAPHNLLAKLPFKAIAGARDVYMNTLGHPGDLILAGMETKEVVNANCKACHTMTNVEVASMEAKKYCTDCHRNVQHMRMKPISTREVADE
jgi:cytochrome c nitrite reductase small subunit